MVHQLRERDGILPWVWRRWRDYFVSCAPTFRTHLLELATVGLNVPGWFYLLGILGEGRGIQDFRRIMYDITTS